MPPHPPGPSACVCEEEGRRRPGSPPSQTKIERTSRSDLGTRPDRARRVMRHPVARMRERFAISPRTYFLVTAVALGALTLIVFTGAAVRVTGSGLGCPSWPRCYDNGRL